jgi:hypothetical protein
MYYTSGWAFFLFFLVSPSDLVYIFQNGLGGLLALLLDDGIFSVHLGASKSACLRLPFSRGSGCGFIQHRLGSFSSALHSGR